MFGGSSTALTTPEQDAEGRFSPLQAVIPFTYPPKVS